MSEPQAGAAVVRGAAALVAVDLPGALAEARARLGQLEQPFTTSAARAALGTTRRVAVPVLEALDAEGATRRLDAVHRTLVLP